jgi:tetratricopeptide (TPR) repeat protein
MESENTVAKLEKTHSLADFLQQKRKFFAGLLVAVIGTLAVFFIVTGVLDADAKKKLAVLEGLIEQYDKLADRIGSETADADAKADIETLRGDLLTFAERAHGYAGAKAWSLAGTIYAKEEKWADAENAFEQSAKKGAKTHLSGPSLFNAGVAAEEGGNVAKAIDYFTRSADVPTSIIGARAQFSIGRLQEAQSDREAARIAYRKVIEDYPDFSGETWRNLAQSRLIVLDENE